MNIVIISTLESGGAASAAKRLTTGLEKLGKFPFFLSKQLFEGYYVDQISSNLFKRAAFYLSKRRFIKTTFIKLSTSKPKPDYFSLPESYLKAEIHPSVKHSDVINLHWTSDFISYPEFFEATRHIAMVITLHDMNYFTGGCHYSFECQKFAESKCEFCWQLQDSAYPNSSEEAFYKKIKSIGLRNPENTLVVAPSLWLLNESKKSKILGSFKHKLVPYGIDTTIFKLTEKQEARARLQLNAKKILLFIATDILLYRKGYHIILELLPFLKEQQVTVLLVGNPGPDLQADKNLILYGSINNTETLSLCYSAADAMIFPTLADNLPNTLLESLCCGTPVLGFTVGGLPDVIVNGENGYLSSVINSQGLQEMVQRFYERGLIKEPEQIRAEAIKNYELKVQAASYLKLYEQAINHSLEDVLS